MISELFTRLFVHLLLILIVFLLIELPSLPLNSAAQCFPVLLVLSLPGTFHRLCNSILRRSANTWKPISCVNQFLIRLITISIWTRTIDIDAFLYPNYGNSEI